jgi:hypothetical protein
MYSKKIILHTNSLTERGTSIAVFDYAYYARQLLDLDVSVAYSENYPSNEQVISKFKKQFPVYSYRDFSQIQSLVDQIHCDYFYAIKYGIPDSVLVHDSKNLVHSVFCRDKNAVHGDSYAVVSEWQSMQSGGNIPYVPHMIDFPCITDDLRSRLGIPEHALVLGRHGAADTFNIEFVYHTLEKVLNKRTDLWVLLLNTEKKFQHERCIYLDTIIDLEEKIRFINTCDAMLHARDYGETFGLSVLEFAALNKQIISYDNEKLQKEHPLGGRNHFLFLKDNCFKYQNQDQLGYLLMHLTRKNPFNTSYLKEMFSPNAVMQKFKEVFL